VRRERDVWQIVNRDRRRGRKVMEDKEMKEWREHFMRLLGGVECKIIGGRESRRKKGVKKEISREEIRETIRSIKNGKSTGLDRILGEV